MKIFVFKTDIKSGLEISILGSGLKKLHNIIRWSVDMHDIDRVLKIVTLDDSDGRDLIRYVRSHGILCEELPD